MAISARLASVYTAMPGVVRSYTRSSQRADFTCPVRVPVPRKDGTFDEVALPVIPNVRVVFPRPRGVVFHYDLEVGEGALLVCSTYSLQEWLRTSQEGSPGDLRTHSISGAVAIVGLHTDADVMTGLVDGFLLGKDGGPPVLFGDTDIKVGSTTASKAAAREGDQVEVQIPPNTVIIAVSGGTLNPAPIVLTGTIQQGSAKVKIAD